MHHEKTFAAIKKLQEIEIELHRLKNALEMANKALDAKREWVGLTWQDLPNENFGNIDFCRGANWAEAKLKEKNT